MATCAGQNALGPCGRPAKYRVWAQLSCWDACRLHLPQLVKHALDTTGPAISCNVEKLYSWKRTCAR